jgi:hypothetical protein
MAQLMRWHKEGICDSEDPNIMSHLADAKAWHALNRFDLGFAWDPRSVHLGLTMDGFQPYSSDSIAYSCWCIHLGKLRMEDLRSSGECIIKKEN